MDSLLIFWGRPIADGPYLDRDLRDSADERCQICAAIRELPKRWLRGLPGA
jgi:hypothetical protein